MNVLTDPLSGNIYFDSCASQHTSTPDLSGNAVSLGFDGCAGLTITSYNEDSQDRFTVAGASGSLFNVNDSLVGTVFSVNDAAGLPIIEVNSDATTDTIAIGEYGTNALFVSAGNVGIGTATPTSPLHVCGNIAVTGTVDGVDIAAKFNGFTGTATDLNYAKDLRATGVTTTEFNCLDGLTATTAELNKIDGFTGTVTDLNYAKDLRATGVTTTEFNCLDGLTATTAELNYSDGVTSNIQTQLNAKQASGTYNTIIGTDSDINTSGCIVIDCLNMTDGVITSHTTRNITLTDLGYTGATNANYITNNNQLTNGAGYTTCIGNVTTNTAQTITGTKNFSGDICVGYRILHTGDSDTCIRFDNNMFRVATGGEEHITACGSGVVINEPGNSNDFRVESNTNTHMLFVDGSADKVGIGCSSPTQKLAVAGDGLFTSDLTVQGDLTVTGDFTCLETTVSLTSAMDITNTGTGPALVVNQTGSNDIVNFQDDGTSAFYIEDGGNVGINDTNPGHRLDVNGSINATGSYKLDDSDVINSGKCFVGVQVRPTTAIADAYISSASNWNSCATSTQGTKADNALPKSGGTITGHIAMSNCNITGVNVFCFNDPGPNEGIAWSGGNTKIYESPDNLTTNSAGNLQMVYGSTRRLTVNNTGIDVNGNIVVSGTVDGVDVAALATCSGLTKTGTVTSVGITPGTGLDVSGSPITTAGNITVNLDLTEVTMGTGLDSTATGITLDLSELTDKTDAIDTNVDEIIMLDNGCERRKRFAEIFGSNAYNSTAFTTCLGDITAVTAGNGLTGGATSGAATLNVGAGTAITVAADTVSVNSTCNSTWNAKTTCTGTTTPSNTQTFTNKSGNISQWTNNSGYTTCTGDITGVTAGSLLDGGGTSGSVTLNVDLSELTDGTGAIVPTSDEIVYLDAGSQKRKLFSEIFGSNAYNSTAFTTCIGDITAVTAGNGLTGGATSGAATLNVGAGTAITVAADTVGVTTACNTAWNAKTTCTGTVTSIATGNGISGGTITGSGTLTVGAGTGLTQTSTGLCVSTTCNTAWNAKTTCTGNLCGCAAQCIYDTRNNFKIGCNALCSNTAGCYNTAIGDRALCKSLCSDNTAIGRDALRCITTGGCNTAIGVYALCTNNGIHNIAIGCSALRGNTTGGCNVALGYGALGFQNSSSGSHNFAAGQFALAYTSTGIGNFGVGSLTMLSNSSGSCNTAIGNSSLQSNTTGGCNIGIGPFALKSNGGGKWNVALGYLALCGNADNCYNFAAGYAAMKSNTGCGNVAIGQIAMCASTASNAVAIGKCTLCVATGDSNVAIGAQALQKVTTGFGNFGLGAIAGFAMTTGNSNIFIGDQAARYMTSGSNNVALGKYAGRCHTNGTKTSGNYNIFIGHDAKASSSTTSNEIVIGASACGVGTNKAIIGSPSLTHVCSHGTFSTISDVRDKTCICQLECGIDFINDLKPKTFNMITDRSNPEGSISCKRHGFIAQEVLELEGDNNVIINNDNPNRLGYTGEHLIPILVKGMQEQQEVINDLKAQIESLSD